MLAPRPLECFHLNKECTSSRRVSEDNDRGDAVAKQDRLASEKAKTQANQVPVTFEETSGTGRDREAE